MYQVTVVYGSYEGAPDEKTIYTNGTAPDETLSRDGYVFAGWTESEKDDTDKTIKQRRARIDGMQARRWSICALAEPVD